MVTQDKLVELLEEGIVQVTFTKKDGTPRVMLCTRKKDLIPTELYPTPEILPDNGQFHQLKTVKVNPNQVRVFDVEKQQWRSFVYSSIQGVELGTIEGIDPLSKVMGILILVCAAVYGVIIVA